MPAIVRLNGLPTVRAADAIVTSWQFLPVRQRREPAIKAVRQRLVSTAELRGALGANPRSPGRADQGNLVQLLEAGCESELEIWGLQHVFDVPGLHHGARQLWLETPVGPVRVDLGYEAERVAMEMDGYTYHSTRQQRERDMRRDAALAAIGWLALRFSHDRLHDDPEGCQRDALATLAARRGRS